MQESTPLWQKVAFMSTTYMLIVFQLAVCFAIASGVETATCHDDNMCRQHEFCFHDQHYCKPCTNYLRRAFAHTPLEWGGDESFDVYGNSTHLQITRELSDEYAPCRADFEDPSGRISGITQYNSETGEWATAREEYFDGCFLKVDHNITTVLRPCRNQGDFPDYSCDLCEFELDENGKLLDGDDDPKNEDCDEACDWETGMCADQIITVTDPSFVCPHDDYICQKCFDPQERVFWYNLPDAITGAIVESMRIGDWVSLFLVTTIIAASSSSELRDIKLCEFSADAVREEGCFIAPCGVCGCGNPWQVALRFAQMLRQFVLLPNLAMLTPALIFNKGGDAITVCFNAVAVLFLLQVSLRRAVHGGALVRSDSTLPVSCRWTTNFTSTRCLRACASGWSATDGCCSMTGRRRYSLSPSSSTAERSCC
jgi:hypothetical protein